MSKIVEKDIPERVKQIASQFSKLTKKPCQGVTSAPGRINLIGEHIDYMGYPVLPAAIRQSTLVAYHIEESCSKTLKLSFINTNEAYSKLTIEFSTIEDLLNLDLTKSHHWTNYTLCGLKGLFKEKIVDSFPLLEIVFLVNGSVPVGKGLSSSSSINCSCTLAYLRIFKKNTLSKSQIANLCISSERLIGMAGGGMDQTISIFGEKGTAKFVEFEPKLKVSPVKLVEGYQFVVADSMVQSNKNQTASKCYNVRVMECRLGAAIIGKSCGVEGWQKTRTLFNLQTAMKNTLQEMIELTKKVLKDGLSLLEVAELLGLQEETLRDNYFMNHGNLIKLEKKEEESLKIQSRCLHVFSEAGRVYEFKKNCGDAQTLGKLMDASHFSCRDLYDASCPELEELTKLCREKGALSSRFTGAGWGGCTISFVKDENVEEFIQAIWKGFYEGKVNVEKRDSVLFNTKPEDGAVVYVV